MADRDIILITGGNTGIGYETVKALYASPVAHTILLGSRSLEKAETAISTIKSEVPESKSDIVKVQIDIEEDSSIDNLFTEVESKYGRIDTLINNAGGSFDMQLRGKSDAASIRDAWDHTYSLNVTSTEVITRRLAPLLIKSSSPRLLFVTSGLSSLSNAVAGVSQPGRTRPPVPAGWPKPAEFFQPTAYRSSKTALNMLAVEWHHMLKEDGAKVFMISPGFLATGLGGAGPDFLKKMGAGDPSSGGIFIKDVSEGKRDADAGQVIRPSGSQPW